MPIELNRDNYETEVNGSDIPVLVDFWGPQCRPCLALMPSVEEIEERLHGDLFITRLEVSVG